MGTFNGPIENLNLLDVEKPLGYRLPRFLADFRLKEWQAFQISNPRWFICLAVYNTKSLGTAIVLAYNRIENRLYRYEHQAPGWRLRVANGLSHSECYYRGAKFSIEIKNRLSDNRFEIAVSARGFKDAPDLSAQWTAHHTTEPCVIVQPFAKNRPLYSHKALMPAEGELTFDGQTDRFDYHTACAIVDDHKGFYPYVMQYDWVTALGNSEQDGLLGFNLTDNQIQNSEKFNENCLWQNAKMVPLPPITVTRPNGVQEPWQIQDQYGLVNLTFTPLQDVPTRINVGVARVDYHGPTGIFEGYIVDANNSRVVFDGFIGMGEKKYIRL
jgi:hypothetical protein